MKLDICITDRGDVSYISKQTCIKHAHQGLYAQNSLSAFLLGHANYFHQNIATTRQARHLFLREDARDQSIDPNRFAATSNKGSSNRCFYHQH